MIEVWERVSADLEDRHRMGVEEYGIPLGESTDDMLLHAYHEALDLACYLRAEIDRRET